MDALQTQTVNSTTAPQPNYIPGLIAVVGCDGTGKSTLTTDLVKSLQQHWQTERRYLGLLSGEDGDKIKRLPLVGVWLERRLAHFFSAIPCFITQPERNPDDEKIFPA